MEFATAMTNVTGQRSWLAVTLSCCSDVWCLSKKWIGMCAWYIQYWRNSLSTLKTHYRRVQKILGRRLFLQGEIEPCPKHLATAGNYK